MKADKEEHNAIGADVLADRGLFTMPALQARASRATAQLMPPTSDAPIQSNISVSNLPGPRVPLHLAGIDCRRTTPWPRWTRTRPS